MSEIHDKLNKIITQLQHQVWDELRQDPRFTGKMSFTFNVQSGGVSGDIEVHKKKTKIIVGTLDT
jgi:hypothetical protein